MSKKRKQLKNSDKKRYIAQITKKRLAILILSLLAALAFFVFKPGEDLWPAWMVDERRVFIAILGFISLFLILISPIIVVAEATLDLFPDPGKTLKQVCSGALLHGSQFKHFSGLEFSLLPNIVHAAQHQ